LRVEIATPEVSALFDSRVTSPAYAAPPFSGQSIHALIEDRFNLNDLREQLMKNGITVTEIRRSLPALKSLRRLPTSIQACWRPPVRNFSAVSAPSFTKRSALAATPQRSFSLSSFPCCKWLCSVSALTQHPPDQYRRLNADGRRESRELIDRLKNSDTFHINRYVETDRDSTTPSLPEGPRRHQDSRGLF